MAKKPVSYLAGSVLLGTAIGAVVGLLATPMSGKEMRGMLRKRATDAGREGSERVREGADKLRESLTHVPDALKDLPQRGRDALADLPRRVTRRRHDPDRPIDTTATTVEPEDREP